MPLGVDTFAAWKTEHVAPLSVIPVVLSDEQITDELLTKLIAEAEPARAFDDRCPNDLTNPNRDNKKIQHQAGLNIINFLRLIGTSIVSFFKYRREYIAWVIQGGTASFTDGIPFSSKATLKQKILEKRSSFAPCKDLAVDRIPNNILLKFIL